MKKWIFSLVLAMGSMAFAAGELSFQLGPDTPYVLPVSMKTCQEQMEASDDSSVAANAFEFNRFSFQWNGENIAEMVFIQLAAVDENLEGGTYSCVVSDANLDATLFPADRYLYNGMTTTAGCAIRCGGIKFKSDVKQAVVPLKATVYAVEVNAAGEVTPVEATIEKAVQYKKVGY